MLKLLPRKKKEKAREGMGRGKGVIGHVAVWYLKCGGRDIKKNGNVM